MSEEIPTTAHSGKKEWIGQAVDFGALIAFIGAYIGFRTIGGLAGGEAMVNATWVLVGASAIALVVGLVTERRIALLPLFVGAMALIFGALTIVFDDPSFIKLKYTAQNAVIAALLLGTLPFRIYPFKYLMRRFLPLTEEGWRGISIRYGTFSLAIAVVNELIWRTQSDDTWISFRGLMWVVMSAFGIWQVFFIMKHLIKDEESVSPVTSDPGL